MSARKTYLALPSPSGGPQTLRDSFEQDPNTYELSPLEAAISSNGDLATASVQGDEDEPLWQGVGKTSFRKDKHRNIGSITSFMATYNPFIGKRRHQIVKTSLGSEPTASYPQYQKKTAWFTGWRMGSLVSCFGVGLCVLLNTIFLIYGLAIGNVVGGVGTIFSGSCDKVKTLDLWLHVALNILGTILLGAGNYNLQFLSSPSRADIDNAHSKGVWLDIGVPSVRNLRHIGRERVIPWFLIFISTLPVHLFWNSTIFSTLRANDYAVMVVSQNFQTAPDLNCTAIPGALDTDYYPFQKFVCSMYTSAQDGELVRLNVQDCIEAYTTLFQSRWSNVIAVSNSTLPYLQFTNAESAVNTSSLQAIYTTDSWNYFWLTNNSFPQVWDVRAWVCSQETEYISCNNAAGLKHALDWKLFPYFNPYYQPQLTPGFDGYTIDHCLASRSEETCKLQFSLIFLIIVLAGNVTKLLTIIYTLGNVRTDLVITLGDAVASFLSNPDSYTSGVCLATKTNLRQTYYHPLKIWAHAKSVSQTKNFGNENLVCGTIFSQDNMNRRKWFEAVSWRRWVVCIIFCSIGLLIAACAIYLAVTDLQREGISLWSIGFGALDSSSTIQASLTLLQSALLVNSFQLLLSSIYFVYNGMYTSMVSAAEWSRFAHYREALRVTTPFGEQRSTYWLQLPWTYSIPLSIASGVMHWLVSASIFVARVEVYDTYYKYSPGNIADQLSSDSLLGCGFSASALVAVMALGSFMVIMLLVNAFRRLDSVMPLVGSCSLAISAACHRPSDDANAAYLPVQWGAVTQPVGREPGHCCLTSFKVEPPIVGQRYAGYEKK